MLAAYSIILYLCTGYMNRLGTVDGWITDGLGISRGISRAIGYRYGNLLRALSARISAEEDYYG